MGLIAQVYVDDIIFRATAESLCEEFAKLMGSEFKISMMGELSFFLGLQVKQYLKDKFICQQKYIRELLKRFDMEASKVIDNTIATATRLDMDETGSLMNESMYRGIIGSLLYLTASRPDIVFSVGLCARFQSNPNESHLKAAKRILRYLKGTQDLVLYYHSGDNFNLIGYADADYAGYLMDRKSTSGMAHFLGSCLISWGTRKQNSVALSTAKAEYVAVAS
ncbi:secreted RxLR effector protein 161-like [Nicotiana sylvestris]|uniref:secreted RxLR effector protein 161-like n=1 Tax=Nicotiana sylvestris TaxID=4096 RepID=UPI00388CA094